MSLDAILGYLAEQDNGFALTQLSRGLERETLRVDPQGALAKDPHPVMLGAALTHAMITTDYSESLLEFITPVCADIPTLLNNLTQTHAYTVQQLAGQQLWPLSMPCDIADPEHIPLAQYGRSNTGKMKTLYRQGLTHRYGALMQVIAGVHYNFSVSETLWAQLHRYQQSTLSLQEFISEGYFGLIRNYRRIMWLLPYLFGASPTLARSFLRDTCSQLPLELEGCDTETVSLPYATSLRMSDLGYTNHEQDQLNISYNSLEEYLAGMKRAIVMPSQKFAEIGLEEDGQRKQLNTNILQIENEFYAPIRAKRVAHSGEKPSQALARGGVEYIEVRALDVNPFSPIGITEAQVQFLDMFLLYCLLSPSAKTDPLDAQRITQNLNTVVLNGRQPGVVLDHAGDILPLQQWAASIVAQLEKIAALFDHQPQLTTQSYQEVLTQIKLAIADPEQTLSGQVVAQMHQNEFGHQQFGLDLARHYQLYLQTYPLDAPTRQWYQAQTEQSLAQQQAIEASDRLPFDAFLADYFADLDQEIVG